MNTYKKKISPQIKTLIIVLSGLAAFIIILFLCEYVIVPEVRFQNRKGEYQPIIEEKCREYGYNDCEIVYSKYDESGNVLRADINIVNDAVASDFSKAVLMLRELHEYTRLAPYLISQGDVYRLYIPNDILLLKNDKPVFAYMSEDDKKIYGKLSEKYPYVGMSDKAIGATCLGLPTSILTVGGGEYYEWRDGDRLLAVVRIEYKTQPLDYHNRTITTAHIFCSDDSDTENESSSTTTKKPYSSPKPSSSKDDNDDREFYDFDDFYEEYYDDFFDEEDAYDYYLEMYS